MDLEGCGPTKSAHLQNPSFLRGKAPKLGLVWEALAWLGLAWRTWRLDWLGLADFGSWLGQRQTLSLVSLLGLVAWLGFQRQTLSLVSLFLSRSLSRSLQRQRFSPEGEREREREREASLEPRATSRQARPGAMQNHCSLGSVF